MLYFCNMKTTNIQREAMKDYYQKNREILKAKKHAYYIEHKALWKERSLKNREHLSIWAKQNNRKLREQAIKEYGGKCECCGEDRFEFLAFDHKDGSGTQHRKQMKHWGSSIYKWLKKNGYPKGVIRILCHNCNLSLGFYKYCPHNLTK